MKKIYFLATCSTCQRIMKDLSVEKHGFILQDIRTKKITETQLDEMISLAGSCEALFSRVALKYRAWGLNEMTLQEKDYKKYILQEDTFLKRPVLLIEGKIYIGNSAKTVQAAQAHIAALKK